MPFEQRLLCERIVNVGLSLVNRRLQGTTGAVILSGSLEEEEWVLWMVLDTFMALLGMLMHPVASHRGGFVVWGFTCF